MSQSLLKELRSLMENLADIPERSDPRVDFSKKVITELELAFRDCQLELFRLEPGVLSEEQIKCLRHLGARLKMVANGNADPSSIPAEARRALVAFGWGKSETATADERR